MSEDFKQDGFNAGYGQSWRNAHHEEPVTEGDKHSFRVGFEEGRHRRRIADELDRELYGEE